LMFKKSYLINVFLRIVNQLILSVVLMLSWRVTSWILWKKWAWPNYFNIFVQNICSTSIDVWTRNSSTKAN
jgi:hypothetical protein